MRKRDDILSDFIKSPALLADRLETIFDFIELNEQAYDHNLVIKLINQLCGKQVQEKINEVVKGSRFVNQFKRELAENLAKDVIKYAKYLDSTDKSS